MSGAAPAPAFSVALSRRGSPGNLIRPLNPSSSQRVPRMSNYCGRTGIDNLRPERNQQTAGLVIERLRRDSAGIRTPWGLVNIIRCGAAAGAGAGLLPAGPALASPATPAKRPAARCSTSSNKGRAPAQPRCRLRPAPHHRRIAVRKTHINTGCTLAGPISPSANRLRH